MSSQSKHYREEVDEDYIKKLKTIKQVPQKPKIKFDINDDKFKIDKDKFKVDLTKF